MDRNQQTNETLLTGYEQYQNDYNAKCSEWRSEPVSERKTNDVGCLVFFFILLGFFIGVGAYYISQKGSIDTTSDLHISTYSGEIIGCLSISLILSFVYIILVKLMPKIMVYTLIILSLAILFGLGILFVAIGAIEAAIPIFITFAIYAVVLYCLRKKIDLGIILIRVASQFLTEKFGIFIAPIIKIITNVLFTFFWIFSLSCILVVAADKSDRNEKSTAEGVFTFLWVFIWLFFNFLFYYMMVFTVAVACSFWYYKVEGKHYLPTAYKWLFTSAFGSIVFAATLIAVITFARMLIDSKRKKSNNIATAVCLCIISICLKSLQNLLKILNHNSVIVMSVTGESFINAAKTTIGILSRFFGLMSVANIITSLLVFWGVIIITGATFGISYVWLDNEDIDSGTFAWLVLISIFGSIMISTMIFSVLVEAVSSVFIFYCFDVKFRELGYSSNNIPPEINEALGNPEFA